MRLRIILFRLFLDLLKLLDKLQFRSEKTREVGFRSTLFSLNKRHKGVYPEQLGVTVLPLHHRETSTGGRNHPLLSELARKKISTFIIFHAEQKKPAKAP